MPGCLLIGDTGGNLNPLRLKGIHLAMKTGMLAAETIADALAEDDVSEASLGRFEERVNESWIAEEMMASRNIHQGFERGLFPGLINAGLSLVTGGRGFADRMEMLPKNIELIKHISSNIKKYCPEAFIITATNPVDPLNYATYLAGGFDPEKLIGYSINDSFRFREMLAKAYNVKVSQVGGTVIGEHGSTQVYLFSTASIDGEKISVSEEVKTTIRSEIPNILKTYEEHEKLKKETQKRCH